VIVHVAVAVSYGCSVRAGSDCDTVVEVLRVPQGVAVLDAAARGRGRLCNPAPPLCVTSVVMNTLSAQCSGVCSCGAVCLGVYVHVALRFPQAAVCGSERALLRCCVAVVLRVAVLLSVALRWMVPVAVSGSSRAAAVAMRRSVRSGCGAVS
jgi:hypothetical protein